MRYRTAGAALEALPNLVRRKGLSIPAVQAIEAELEQSEKWGVRIIASCEPDYPKYLRAVDPTPPLISVKGRVEILHAPCVAIVGSRNASAIGQRFARQIAGELGELAIFRAATASSLAYAKAWLSLRQQNAAAR